MTTPCPWCKSVEWEVESTPTTDKVVTSYDANNGPVYQAVCTKCFARGPIVGWAADAIAVLEVTSMKELIDRFDGDR